MELCVGNDSSFILDGHSFLWEVVSVDKFSRERSARGIQSLGIFRYVFFLGSSRNTLLNKHSVKHWVEACISVMKLKVCGSVREIILVSAWRIRIKEI